MSKFKVEIDIDNAAFEDSSEVSRILRDLADRVEVQVVEGEVTVNRTADHVVLRDVNGNTVGQAWTEVDQ